MTTVFLWCWQIKTGWRTRTLIVFLSSSSQCPMIRPAFFSIADILKGRGNDVRSVGGRGVNKAVLGLALGVRVPATLITINTLICARVACRLNEGASTRAHPLSATGSLTHVSLPHVSGNEGEGLRIQWKMGCQVGRKTLLWFPPHRNFEALLASQYKFYPPMLYCAVTAQSFAHNLSGKRVH